MDALQQYAINGFSVVDLGIALLGVVVGFALARVVQVILTKLIARTPKATLRFGALEALLAPAVWAFRLGGIWGALSSLPLDRVQAVDLQRFVNNLYQASTIGLATWLGVRLVSNIAALWARRASSTEGTFDDQLVPIVRSAARVFLIITGAVMILQNLGYSVSSLLAGLGIGGAAVAFASKDTIANVFGSLVIFIDRPFQVGDWVEIGDVEGTVETVQIRSTEIRTFANSLVTLPNAQMATTAINNWSRMRKRRLKIDLRLSPSTPADKVDAVVAGVRKIIDDDERFDSTFALVNFNNVSEWSLDILVYCFTSSTVWAQYMQTRQEFLLAVMRLLEKEGVPLALPARVVHTEGGGKPGPLAGLRRTG